MASGSVVPASRPLMGTGCLPGRELHFVPLGHMHTPSLIPHTEKTGKPYSANANAVASVSGSDIALPSADPVSSFGSVMPPAPTVPVGAGWMTNSHPTPVARPREVRTCTPAHVCYIAVLPFGAR